MSGGRFKRSQAARKSSSLGSIPVGIDIISGKNDAPQAAKKNVNDPAVKATKFGTSPSKRKRHLVNRDSSEENLSEDDLVFKGHRPQPSAG